MYANMFVIIDIRIEQIWSKRKRKGHRKRGGATSNEEELGRRRS